MRASFSYAMFDRLSDRVRVLSGRLFKDLASAAENPVKYPKFLSSHLPKRFLERLHHLYLKAENMFEKLAGLEK